ncbi:MAG: SUMF1/EgtB/PvdO family nonheme iron enzyme [Planctomycetes bacterium]|nr:SUMF1/EgtB/PvdO family nonheme iron enzyme [Planctomycetota bacterium]
MNSNLLTMSQSVAEFTKRLTDSGLISAEEVRALIDALQADQRPVDGESLAREMVQQNKLTKFQAEQIYAGKGKTLTLGNYIILEKLGQGGMGMVLKAMHKRMERVVALKVMAPAAMKSPDAVKRFHREVQAAAKLTHPNIVIAFDADEAHGTHFLVMEYVGGTDLSALVKKQGPLTVGKAIECIKQAARGLEYAHEHGVIHRDIKPANLLIDAKGTVKILDMGLARIEGETGQAELTSTGAVMGTVDYMAPEQALSTKSADARSDIYSLGISLWYLLTGKCAYDGDTLMAKLLAHRDAPVPSLCSIRADLPPPVDAVFQKMVAKQAMDRYQTMTEVLQALESCHSGSSTSLKVMLPSEESQFQAPSNILGSSPTRSATVKQPLQATSSYGTSDPASEVTMLSSDAASATDPQTMTSVRKLVTKRAAPSSPLSIQRGKLMIAGVTTAVVLLAIMVWWSASKARPEKDSDSSIAGNGGTSKLVKPPSQFREGQPTTTPPMAIAPFNEAQAKAHQKAWADHLGAPVEYTNSIGMKFILIPPGGYWRGASPQEIQAATVENSLANEEDVKSATPWHQVILTQPIYLGVHEVTQLQYETVTGGNPSHFSPNGSGKDAVVELDTTNFPVETVSWNDAVKFCATLSELEQLKPFYSLQGDTIAPRDGNGYRLPTDAEWEFALRAGTTTRFWTSDWAGDQGGWFLGNSGGRPHAVGSLKANPFGIYDIHGSVWEWVQDGWDATSYSQFQEKVAVDPVTPFSVSSERTHRMGDFGSPTQFCLPWIHHFVHAEFRQHNIGFRVSLTVDAVKQALANRIHVAAPPPAVAPFNAAQARAHQEAWAKHLEVPVEFTNGLGAKFVLVPPGQFRMGSTLEEIAAAPRFPMEDDAWKTCYASEGPQHDVVLTKPFYIGVCEVTQSEYMQVTGKNPSDFTASGGLAERVKEVDTAAFPVEKVNWNDAVAFCGKLSEREGLKPLTIQLSKEGAPLVNGNGYRLPTEAEWEFACRAGTTTTYWSGNNIADLNRVGWSGANAGHRTHAVGELPPNPFGLYDVHGNVWEWVYDRWEPDDYARRAGGPVIDPWGPTAPSQFHGVRGGFWGTAEQRCTSARRFRQLDFFGHGHNGFRIVLSVDGVKQMLDPTTAKTGRVEHAAPESPTISWVDWLGPRLQRNEIGGNGWIREGEAFTTEREISGIEILPGTTRDGALRLTYLLRDSNGIRLNARDRKTDNTDATRELYVAEDNGTDLYIIKFLAGKPTQLASRAIPASIPKDSPRTLEFRVVGETLTATLNGSMVLTAKDSSNPGGNFALVALQGLLIQKLEYQILDRAK